MLHRESTLPAVFQAHISKASAKLRTLKRGLEEVEEEEEQLQKLEKMKRGGVEVKKIVARSVEGEGVDVGDVKLNRIVHERPQDKERSSLLLSSQGAAGEGVSGSGGSAPPRAVGIDYKSKPHSWGSLVLLLLFPLLAPVVLTPFLATW